MIALVGCVLYVACVAAWSYCHTYRVSAPDWNPSGAGLRGVAVGALLVRVVAEHWGAYGVETLWTLATFLFVIDLAVRVLYRITRGHAERAWGEHDRRIRVLRRDDAARAETRAADRDAARREVLDRLSTASAAGRIVLDDAMRRNWRETWPDGAHGAFPPALPPASDS